MVLGGTCVIAGQKRRRQVAIENFFAGPGKTVLAPDEMLVEILIPPPPPHSAGAYERLIPRNEMDIAIVGVGSFVVMAGPKSSQVKEARIALAAVAPTPVRAKEAEGFLAGKALTEAAIEQAGELAAHSASPITDMRGSKEYRLEMVKAFTRKTLRQCAQTLGITL
jgi:carbon-monoxide dehydrogenase medium subunit